MNGTLAVGAVFLGLAATSNASLVLPTKTPARLNRPAANLCGISIPNCQQQAGVDTPETTLLQNADITNIFAVDTGELDIKNYIDASRGVLFEIDLSHSETFTFPATFEINLEGHSVPVGCLTESCSPYQMVLLCTNREKELGEFLILGFPIFKAGSKPSQPNLVRPAREVPARAEKASPAPAHQNRILARSAAPTPGTPTGYLPKSSEKYGDYLHRGIDLTFKHQYDEAIAQFDEAIRLGSRDAAIFNGRGFAFMLKLDYKSALKDLDEALRLDPDYLNAVHNRAITRRALGDAAGGRDDDAYEAQLKRKFDVTP